MKQTVIQLVPRCTSEPSGVAQYASQLALALRVLDVNTVFLAGVPTDQDKTTENEWHTVTLPSPKPRMLAKTIQSLAATSEAAAILLHYSGYGYERRGAPLWLLHGLRSWHHRSPGHLPLITIFHELYATGRPWQSSYWLSPVQRLIARRILGLSSGAIATTELYRDRLLSWHSNTHVTCMPVFSNVGEPGCGAAPDARPAVAVIFGLAGVEDRLFGLYRPELEQVITTLRIEKILDIGPRILSPPVSLAGVPVIAKGALPAFAVSELLQNARFGLVSYPFDVMAKSGVFAAYAAHGVIPVVFPERRGRFDGLQAGLHFIDALRNEALVDVGRLALMQRELFAWYKSHSLQAQASLLKEFINRIPHRTSPSWIDYPKIT